MKMEFTTFGGRRFLLAIGVAIVASLLQFLGKLDPSGAAYVTLVLGTVGTYITGSTVEAVKANNLAAVTDQKS